MMPDRTPPSDAAITDKDGDELGRAPFAALLADSVREAPAQDGYVIGLTGSWGSGKTSVLNMVEEALGDDAYVVRFNPWMFSSADVLVVRFFSTIAQVLEAEVRRQEDAEGEPTAGRTAGRTIKDAAGPLRTVAEGMAKVGAAAAPIASILLGGIAGQVLEAPQKALEQLGQPENDPEALRDQLRDGLRELERKIVVFIDDLDRVGSHEEVRELVRLVKLVGDLPNVVYVLSYEPTRVERALADPDGNGGREYLEKVVQAPYALPEVRPGRLHEYCGQLLDAHFDGKWVDFDPAEWAKLAPSVFGYLRTVRDVKRLVNASILEMRLAGDEIASQDVLAMAALRVFDRDVHGRLADIARDLTGRVSILDFRDESEKRAESRKRIEEVILAGDRHDLTRKLVAALFAAAPMTNEIVDADKRVWRKRRRVASPAVLDTYLHASLDDTRLSTGQLNEILDALADPARARDLLDPLTKDQVADLLDRIGDHPDRLPADDAVGPALEVLRLRPRLGQQIGFGMPHEAKIMRAVNALVDAVPQDRRLPQIDDLVSRAESVSDASMLLLGGYGSSEQTARERTNPDDVHLSPKRTAQLEDQLRARIRDDPGRLPGEGDFGQFFSWLVERDPPTLAAVRATASIDDRLFLRLLESCVHLTRSSAPPYDIYELQAQDLERRLGPIKDVAGRAAVLAVDDPPKRLAAGLKQLDELAAAA